MSEAVYDLAAGNSAAAAESLYDLAGAAAAASGNMVQSVESSDLADPAIYDLAAGAASPSPKEPPEGPGTTTTIGKLAIARARKEEAEGARMKRAGFGTDSLVKGHTFDLTTKLRSVNDRSADIPAFGAVKQGNFLVNKRQSMKQRLGSMFMRRQASVSYPQAARVSLQPKAGEGDEPAYVAAEEGFGFPQPLYESGAALDEDFEAGPEEVLGFQKE